LRSNGRTKEVAALSRQEIIMRKLATVSAVLGLALLAGGGTAVAATTAPQQRVNDLSPAAERYTQALNILEDKGYVNFTNFHQTGNEFAATINRDGKSMTVTIDPDQGTVH
jgi:hypothetical protein